MDADRKTTSLKELQGHVWRRGYESGTLRAALFDDVPPAFARLHARGIGLHIYSSGSVTAQLLLLAHTTAGDLTPLISRYFDTTTGPKRVAASYEAIAAAVGAPPAQLLFATDVWEEAVAARDAGYGNWCCCCCRRCCCCLCCYPLLSLRVLVGFVAVPGYFCASES
jgi:enolase-phosphatase E1